MCRRHCCFARCWCRSAFLRQTAPVAAFLWHCILMEEWVFIMFRLFFVLDWFTIGLYSDCKTFRFTLFVQWKFVPFYVFYFCRLFGLFCMFVCCSIIDFFSLFSCWRTVELHRWVVSQRWSSLSSCLQLLGAVFLSSRKSASVYGTYVVWLLFYFILLDFPLHQSSSTHSAPTFLPTFLFKPLLFWFLFGVNVAGILSDYRIKQFF